MSTYPLMTVNDGLQLLGHIFETSDGRFRAEGPDGEDPGTFVLCDAARSAIMSARIASRSMGGGNG